MTKQTMTVRRARALGHIAACELSTLLDEAATRVKTLREKLNGTGAGKGISDVEVFKAALEFIERDAVWCPNALHNRFSALGASLENFVRAEPESGPDPDPYV